MTKRSHEMLLSEAQTLHAAGRLDEAAEKYRKALQIEPANAHALQLIGALYLQQGKAADAAGHIEQAISVDPGSAEMYVNLGSAYRALGRTQKAAQTYRKALEINPRLDAASYNLGHALQELDDYEGAAAAYKSYLAAHPMDAEAHNVLGDAYKKLGRYEDAIDAYESALLYDPERFGALSNIAVIVRDLGWHHAAQVIIDRTAALAPEDYDILRTQGVIRLQFGDFGTGWPGLDNRFYTATEQVVLRSTPPSYWRGEDLSGRSILVWTEQGLGDEILHASILPDVAARAERCIIECSKRLVPVFARSFPAATVVGYEASHIPVTPAEGIDYQVPVASLGRHFRPDFASFPRHDGYLKADPAKVAELRARYEAMAKGRRIVGLSWRSKNEFAGESKSTTLTDLAPVLQVPGVMFVNLQYGDCTEDLAEARRILGVEMVQDPAVDSSADMDAFFAQVAAMDLVVSTSNTTVHTAGAQNVPVWVLLPHGKGSIWYWFLRRTDSPWYPSARLIRADYKLEPGPAQWRELAERTAGDLARWADEFAPHGA